MNTPWGPSQTIDEIFDGIQFVSTSGHGGFKVENALNNRIPDYWRNDDGWYEEDCEAAIVVLVFEKEFREAGKASDSMVSELTQIAKDFYPREYEKFSGQKIPVEESYLLRKEAFAENNKDNYVVITAWGDWEHGVPKGMVKVEATLGGNYTSPRRAFLVTEDEYKQRDSNGFVINLEKHQEIV